MLLSPAAPYCILLNKLCFFRMGDRYDSAKEQDKECRRLLTHWPLLINLSYSYDTKEVKIGAVLNAPMMQKAVEFGPQQTNQADPNDKTGRGWVVRRKIKISL